MESSNQQTSNLQEAAAGVPNRLKIRPAPPPLKPEPKIIRPRLKYDPKVYEPVGKCCRLSSVL